MIHDRPNALSFHVTTRWGRVADRKKSSPRDVLIVDDNRDLVDVVKALLESDGYSCRSADNGQQALEMIALARPALVLLDMDMPVMNGWECSSKLRAIYGRALPIVIMSANRNEKALGAKIDAEAVLSKPFDVAQLRRIVARYVVPAR
jgi:CheY-like chemotaxis protein